MEKQEREREKGKACDGPAAYPPDGTGQRMRNQVEPTNRVFIPQPTSALDPSHSLPAANGTA